MNRSTPGPWFPVEDAQGICGLLHPRKKGVAVAWFSSLFSPQNGYVGEEEHELGRPERQANAHLIAAAPEMLAELERLAEHFGWDEKHPSVKLIAKAKGET